MTRSLFIALEGTDGSGKSTHAQLLSEHLQANGHTIKSIHFPRYGQPSAYFVEQYLSGQFGTLADTDAYKGSLFYAMDRFAASFEIKQWLAQGHTILSDRYVGSNLAHQGSKISHSPDRKRFYEWGQNLEFDILGIPKPNLYIVLIMPPLQGQKFVDAKPPLAYLAGKQRDLHEDNADHLNRAAQNFVELCQAYPDKYLRVDCAQDGNILPIATIQAQIRKLVAKHVPQ